MKIHPSLWEASDSSTYRKIYNNTWMAKLEKKKGLKPITLASTLRN